MLLQYVDTLGDSAEQATKKRERRWRKRFRELVHNQVDEFNCRAREVKKAKNACHMSV